MNETKDGKSLPETGDEKVSPIRRREIIKTLLIIFLAAMLVLTFFSNTIMNKSLSEISTETAVSGKLTERVRGRGMVESNQSYEVKTEDNKVIETIHIKNGQEINKGDLLFTLGEAENEGLNAAEELLDSLELAYQEALLKDPVDYSSENQAIKNAREDLNQAIAKRDAAAVNDNNASRAREQYRSNKAELNRLTGIQTKLSSAITAIDTDSYIGAAPEYIGDLPALLSDYASAAEEYETAYGIYQEAIASGDNAELAKSDADQKQLARDSARTIYNDAKSSIRSSLADQLRDIDNSVEYYSAAVSNYEDDYGSGGGDTYEACAELVRQKQRELESLINELSKTQNSNSVSDKKLALEIESKKKAYEKQKEKVEKLKKEAGTNEITSKYSGVVSSINVKPNDTVIAGDIIAVIDIADAGYTVKVSVDGEKVKKVKKGAQADVVNNWNDDIEAVLTDIKNDTAAGSKNKILIFSLTGDVDSGSYIDLSIPCGSGNYDAIIPRSALKSDSNGDFVLTVRSKNTPLGNRYYADRVNVQVEASDETSYAVSGVSGGDYVITAASKPVSAGDQVRMKDK